MLAGRWRDTSARYLTQDRRKPIIHTRSPEFERESKLSQTFYPSVSKAEEKKKLKEQQLKYCKGFSYLRRTLTRRLVCEPGNPSSALDGRSLTAEGDAFIFV